MTSLATLDQLKIAGAGIVAPEAVSRLYAEAFRRFGVQALWSRIPMDQPTIAEVAVVAQGLRREGDMAAWRMAADLEAACRAAL